MINCILIDDEPLALKVLEDFLQKIPFLNLVGKFEDPMKAIPALEKGDIGLLFLDIRMPGISGIDFLHSLSVKPKVIFTTAYSEYAIDVFGLNVVDYLLKPVSFEKLLVASARAKAQLEEGQNPKPSRKDYFFINASHKLHKIIYHDVLYLEGFKDYTKIYLKNSPSPLLVLYNLKYFESLLEDYEFIRIHRSYIVPVRMLDTITRKAVTIGSKNLPISDNYRERFFAMIEKNSG